MTQPSSLTAYRRAGYVCIAVIAVLGISRCATMGPDPRVCPAIGWINTVEINLVGPVGDVDLVRLCIDTICTAGAEFPSTDTSTFSPSPEQTVIEGGYSTQVDDTTWSIAVDMSTPDDVTVQALSTGGVVLAETRTSLEWTRVGGSAECGGRGVTGPVELVIPG